MRRSLPKFAFLLTVLWLHAPAGAQELTKLKAYNAPIAETSISGISSGAFMAVQFGVAWSSIITGVGVVAGGPYYCSRTTLMDNLASGGVGPIFAATGPCMSGPPGDLAPLFKEADSNAASGAIDALANLARQKIYLFHGFNDAVVAKSVVDATQAFYRRYDSATNLFYQSALGAGHSFVVNLQGEKKLDSCPANQAPYIDQCGYDQAGALLQQIYGALNPPVTGALSGKIESFAQSAYTGADIPSALSLADKGYVYVPADCEAGAACRLHVALHGCEQNAETIGNLFYEQAGYNRWADSNHIVVLYPQTTASLMLPFNPKGCWDWWGYVTFDDHYVTKNGKQIAAIKAMIDALTVATPLAGDASGNFALVVNDISDSGASLAWTAAPGAEAYRVSRAGADGVFAPLADVSGLSFADSGLSATAAYSWRVAPLIAGAAQAPSNTVGATTLASPAPCAAPGSCPLPRR